MKKQISKKEYFRLQEKIQQLKDEYEIMLNSDSTTINYRSNKRNYGSNERSVYKSNDYPLLNQICINAIKQQLEQFEKELSEVFHI